MKEQNSDMVHRLGIKPRFGELDPYNHVNHSVYVAWFEAARCEALESIGLGLHVLSERGFQIVVADLTVKYRSPAKAGDSLVVETTIESMSGVISIWKQSLIRIHEDTNEAVEVLCLGEIRAGFCNAMGRPTRCPTDIQEALQALAG
jgi:acyl-CoA thioester hydrolase